MRLASSGVGGVRRVRLALWYVGSRVGILWMYCMLVFVAVTALDCISINVQRLYPISCPFS